MADLTTFGEREARRFARQWEDLFYRGDAAAMASHYAEDAELLARGEEVVRGRPAIERFWCVRGGTLGERTAHDRGARGAPGSVGIVRVAPPRWLSAHSDG